MSEGDLPVVDPADVKPVGGQQRIGGILLAAGESSRFQGGNKLLATYDGEPLVWHAGLALVQAGLDPLVAVVGHEADGVESAIAGLGFETVHNPDFADGQATSVSQAVEAIAGADAVVIALGDMPAVDPRSIEALVDAYRAGEADALAAAYEGKRGNPVVFDSRYFAELRDVEGDRGGRGILLAGGDSALVETGDRGVLADVDTRADLDDVREVHG